MIILVLPGLRIIPAIYKWRFKSRLLRWYHELMIIEQRLLHKRNLTNAGEGPLEKLDKIEQAVNRMKVPALFAEQFYNLRGHIKFVHQKMV